MRNRWGILAVLFAVRATMAFQFQSVAAVAPLLSSEYGVGLADIGVLIGLYFAPGVALALPGGAIGQRFGDKATVVGALLLMLAGSVAMASAASWNMQIAGRLVGGAGGVILSVQMTKMLTDWFAGKEIATAMAIFVNSWPAGIAVALLTLPVIGTGYGIAAVHSFGRRDRRIGHVAHLCPVQGATEYRGRDRRQPCASSPRGARRDRGGPDLGAVQCRLRDHLQLRAIDAGRARLVGDRGGLGHQHRAVGGGGFSTGWAASSPIAAGAPELMLVAGCILFAALMLALPRSGAVIPIVAALGLVSGQPAGPIMSLPARVLQPQTRAIGMGLFFTIFYGCMVLGPVVGGACAKWAGTAAAAFDFGAAMILLCPLILWAFKRIPHATPRTA